MNLVWLALVAIAPIAIGATMAALSMRYISVSAIDGMTRHRGTPWIVQLRWRHCRQTAAG